jgi:hypothetical protein
MSISFGTTPGIQIDVEGNRVGDITVGTSETLVVFARGDPTSGTATTNSPEPVGTLEDADQQFGEGTPLADLLRDAIVNGADAIGGNVFGVMPEEQAVSGEAVNGGSGTLANAPIHEDLSTISVQNTTDATAADVEFRYDSPLTAPSAGNTIHLNPYTGEVEAGDTDDYAANYEFYQWADAFAAADRVVPEGESGVWAIDHEAESVVLDAQAEATVLREQEFRMIKVLGGAQPNSNTAEDPPTPAYDAQAYTDSVDEFATFLAAPARQDDSRRSILGGLGGLAAGLPLTTPLLTQGIDDVSIETGVDRGALLAQPERSLLAGEQVLTVDARSGNEVTRTPSTDTELNFETTFQSVRVADRAVLGVREVAKAFRGRLDVDAPEVGTEELAAQAALQFLEGLVDERLLQPNTDEEPGRLFVRPADGPPGTVALTVGITPTLATDTFETDISVSL